MEGRKSGDPAIKMRDPGIKEKEPARISLNWLTEVYLCVVNETLDIPFYIRAVPRFRACYTNGARSPTASVTFNKSSNIIVVAIVKLVSLQPKLNLSLLET